MSTWRRPSSRSRRPRTTSSRASCWATTPPRSALEGSRRAEAKDRRTHLEAAAAQIANIANEGDKPIQAIRQRLAKAGHTHNSDADTKEDYMFIDSKEKKLLLDLSRRAGQVGTKAEPDDVRARPGRTR
jgi:hypothetical protein